MGEAVRLYRAAGRSLGQSLGEHEAGRLVLSLFFKATLGIERIFHFETIDDPGLALLTGGRSVLSRTHLGALVRKVTIEDLRRMMSKTRSRLRRSAVQRISIDEHAIARFTRKFRIPKGFHTIRNKTMPVEKLFFTFDVTGRRLLSLISTPGDRMLAETASSLLPQLRRQARGAQLRVILDAGAAENHEELMHLVDHPNQVTLVRVPRRRSYREKWKSLPADQWRRLEEAGPYKGAAPKVIHLAETRTALKVQCTDQERCQDKSGWLVNVRTIVVREAGRRGKDRWHAVWVFGDGLSDGWELVQEFRGRQNQEQRYRVLVHDAFVDSAASGYDKQSPQVDSPSFIEGALSLTGWLAAMSSNVLDELSLRLPQRFHHGHLRTLRRWFLNVPGEVYLGSGTVVVLLHPRRQREVWRGLVEWTNRRRVRVPWLENRRLVLSLSSRISRQDQEFSSDPLQGL